MKSADLPKENAFEPDEGAHQPSLLKMPGHNISKKLTFEANMDMTAKPSSQTSSYKDMLSQPASSFSHVEKMIWLQKRRTAGLWAQCDECDNWRYLPDIIDRHELPDKWYCSMNPDRNYASCSVPEAPLRLRDEEDLIHSHYTAGSLVWARLTGWPWWPAMVDDCPDTEQFYWLDGFSDIPTNYNVVFFDNMETTRAWITTENLKPYASNRNTFKYLLKNKKIGLRLKAAMSQADEADSLTIEKRLEKFSFISRYKGNINSPKKVNTNELKKYQRHLKKKFNIEFPISDSEEEMTTESLNVVILGTPKRAREETKGKSATKRRLIKYIEEDLMTAEEKDKQITTEKSEIQNRNSKVIDTDKTTNSILAQVGSSEPTTIDNDTSTTYLPNNGSGGHTLNDDKAEPKSDDFEF